MTSRPRISPVGTVQHVVQRANNHEKCFIERSDYLAFLSKLQRYSLQYGVNIHAWVLMSNHYHLLCTPTREHAISDMARSVAQSYVPYFNQKYFRRGKLWQGRFYSSIVDSERYFFEVSRYIELNPVRAKIVRRPEEYVWSSYRTNALGKTSTLIRQHSLYVGLSSEQSGRCKAYNDLFHRDISDDCSDSFIKAQTRSCFPIGDDSFITNWEKRSGFELRKKKVGRPSKDNK